MQVTSLTKRYNLADKPFARGGEGSVYDVQGMGNFVAKVYHEERRTPQREEKIKAMIASPPTGEEFSQMAWPCDILYDAKTKRFLGFVMPRIHNFTKIDELYSYDRRNQHSWAWYIHAAQNLCAAVESVHKCGHVIGDLNPANICVDVSTALVTLVDTDSYSIDVNKTKPFHCAVRRPEYASPEVNRGFQTGRPAKFTVQDDCFVLAIHIFSLLMNGSHPYACATSSERAAEHYSLLNNLSSGTFLFDKGPDGVTKPMYAPALSALTPKLRKLCVAAFGGKAACKCPTPRMWYDALEELKNSLRQCGANDAHQYRSDLSKCPLCEVTWPPPPPPPPPPPIGSGTSVTITGGSIIDDMVDVLRSILWVVFVGLKHILLFAIWVASNLGIHYLMLKAPWSNFFFGLCRYLMLGIAPFVLMWVVIIIALITDSDALYGIAGVFLLLARYLAIPLYILAAIWSGLDGGSLLNGVIWAALACLPIIGFMKLCPVLTIDLHQP